MLSGRSLTKLPTKGHSLNKDRSLATYQSVCYSESPLYSILFRHIIGVLQTLKMRITVWLIDTAKVGGLQLR